MLTWHWLCNRQQLRHVNIPHFPFLILFRRLLGLQLLLKKKLEKKDSQPVCFDLIWRQPCKLGHQAGDNWACNYEKSKMQMKVWIRWPVKTTSGHLTYFLSWKGAFLVLTRINAWEINWNNQFLAGIKAWLHNGKIYNPQVGQDSVFIRPRFVFSPVRLTGVFAPSFVLLWRPLTFVLLCEAADQDAEAHPAAVSHCA